MRRILVGYDGSEQGKEAARVAADLARRYGASVTVLSVGQVAVVLGIEPVIPPVGEDVEREIAEEGARLVSEQGVATEARHEVGDPANEIVRVASEGDFDLIVIGHRGLSAIERWLLGSVALRVVAHAPCPVLVVRQGERFLREKG